MIAMAIETSTERGGVAIVADDRELFAERFPVGRDHAAALFLALERAVAALRTTPAAARCDRVAVGIGPGGYSGLRVGIGAAVGLRVGLGAELVGIPSALGFAAPEYVFAGNARRGECFFTRIKDARCSDGPRLVPPEAVLSLAAGVPVFLAGPVPAIGGGEVRAPDAVVLARLAAAGRGIVRADPPEPIYLRPPHITTPRPDAPRLAGG